MWCQKNLRKEIRQPRLDPGSDVGEGEGQGEGEFRALRTWEGSHFDAPDLKPLRQGANGLGESQSLSQTEAMT